MTNLDDLIKDKEDLLLNSGMPKYALKNLKEDCDFDKNFYIGCLDIALKFYEAKK
jgi:hypothetical protein